MHFGIALFYHHFMLATGLPGTLIIGYPANASSNKTNEKDKPYHNKEP
jgi:hypothetical protein